MRASKIKNEKIFPINLPALICLSVQENSGIKSNFTVVSTLFSGKYQMEKKKRDEKYKELKITKIPERWRTRIAGRTSQSTDQYRHSHGSSQTCKFVHSRMPA